MSTSKTRADAVLKNLPPQRQEEIFARLTEQTDSWPDTSLRAVREWLAEDGCNVSRRALSEFRSWYSARQDLQATADLLETFEEFTRTKNPGWSTDQVRETSVQFLMAHTAAKRDVSKFVSVAQLDQNERFGRTKAKLDERKVQVSERRQTMMEKKAAAFDQAKDVIASELSPEEQRKRLKEILK